MTASHRVHAGYPPSVATLRRSPLAYRAGDLAAGSSAAVRLAELPFLTQLNLRVDPATPAAGRIAEALGAALPPAGSVCDLGRRSVIWLGPDEWLVIGPDGDVPALVGLLTAALAKDRGSVVDVSADRAAVIVAGPAARAVLEKGITLDLHPRTFGPGRAAATTLARTQVVLWQTGAEPAYRVLVRNSFASYLVDWLMDAAMEFAVGVDG